MTSFLLGFVVGAAVAGAACVVSSKVFGFFNKQVASIKTDVAAKV